MEAALAREVLSGDWLRLDRMYIDRVRRYEEQRAAGNLTARLIDRGDAYLEDLDQLAIRERIAFFAEMREHLRPKILNEDREEVEAPLHVTYLDALLRHVIDTFWSTERLKELRDRPAVDSSSFRNLSRLEALVRKSEQMLDDDLRAVETNLFQRPEDLFVNILSTEDDLTEAELKDYHLQSYTMKGGPHPVQVRAFLYAVAKEAARRRDTIDLDQLRKAALKAGAVFDDQAPAAGGDDSVRSNPRILEKARRFANQGILDRLTGKAGSFIGEYARYFNVSLNHIRRLAEAAVTYKVLNLLLQEVGALAQTYAGLFTEAGRVLERLVDEVRREEERHTARGGAFSGNLFIYADPDSKRQAWEDLRLRIAGLRQTEAANTALNRAVFQKHRSHRKQRSEVDFRALRQVFETTVIEEFAISAVRKDLAPVWSFSVIEAAKREAALNRGDWRERLKLAVDLVARQAEPFLELDDINRGQAIIFWAISPAIREEYNDSATFDALFTLKQGEQPYEREEFSDRELLCMNNRVNLELRHLAKLNPGGLQTANVNETPRGRYRGAYADRIARLIDEEIAARSIGGGRRFAATVTPHIHRDWHRCGQLPEIFPESQRRERLALARAFLVALGLGLLQREIDYGRSVTNFSTVGRSGRAGIRERFAETHSLWEVYRAFAERADLVRATLDVWAGEKAALAADVPLDRHQPLIDMAGAEAVKRILEIGAPRTEIEERELVCRDLFAARYLLVVDVADAVLPHLDTPGRRDLVEAFETATAAEAFDSFRRRQGLREETLRSLRDVHAEGTKDGRLDSTAR